jgi:hypothetical protein
MEIDSLKCTRGYMVSFEGDENVLKLAYGDGLTTQRSFKNHFKQVSFMVCELYLKKAVF